MILPTNLINIETHDSTQQARNRKEFIWHSIGIGPANSEQTDLHISNWHTPRLKTKIQENLSHILALLL